MCLNWLGYDYSFDIKLATPAMSGLVADTHANKSSFSPSSSNTEWDTWLPMLPNLSANFPWSLNDVSKVLRLGRAREHFRTISPQTIERVCFLLQRPLLRIVIEAERLSHEMERCTKRELQTSLRLILSPTMAKNCLQLASKALLLFSTSGEQQFQRSKRARSGLIFPVGRIFSWLVEMKVACRVYDAAAIYLSAALEFIAEETVFKAVLVSKDTVDQVTPEMIESCINSDPDLWCLYQPYVHLLSGRTSFGLIDSLDIYICKNKSTALGSTKPNKTTESYFTTTCVSSLDELKEILPRVQHRFSQMTQNKENVMFYQLEWLPIALDTLFYFMTCTHNLDGTIPAHVLWNNKRAHHRLPPLIEWMRVAGVHAEHRSSGMVDDEDVRQAARLLLPFNICNYRIFGPDSSRCASKSLTSSESEMSFKTDLGLRMLLSGRSDLVSKALAIFGSNIGISMDERGLTPLMYACMQGNAVLVQSLLNSHVLLDTKVPRDKKRFPMCDPGVYSWTALSFAATKGRLRICQMLLDYGANVDGAVDASDINEGVETPLQMAVTAGNYDLVSLLCARKADVNVVFPVGVGKLGLGSPFAAAAAFGYRKILRKLLAEAPSPQEDELMSLAEILAEGSPSSKSRRSLSKKRCRALQEAMYHSCEHGYLDVAMEIRSLGVPWNLHCWAQALCQAYDQSITLSMTSQMRCLLRDFHSIQQCEYTAEFCDDGLTMLFTIFKECQDRELLQELASVFSSCYGDEPMPLIIKEIPSTTTPGMKIGANYVNNKEMSDVTFLVENQSFYGHRIILTAASSTFKEILSSKSRDQQDQSCIEIPDIKYDIFWLLMQHVYTGRVDSITPKHTGKLIELLHASFVFQLEALQRHCEKLLSENTHSKNVIRIYEFSRRYKSDSLTHYCECFILSNMKDVALQGDMSALFSTDQATAILSSLHRCLSERIKARASRSPRKSLF